MSKHTPGPWHKTDTLISGPNGERVIDCRGAMGGDDTQADARLIAAAPEFFTQSTYNRDLMRDVATMIENARPELAEALHRAATATHQIIAKAEGFREEMGFDPE